MERLRVLTIDDHPVILLGLRQLLENEPHFCLCGEAASVNAARLQAESLQPDIIVLDLVLDKRDSLELIKDLHYRVPAARMVVYSALPESAYAERAFRAGARGYVEKSMDIEAVLEAIKAVAGGGWYASTAVQRRSFSRQMSLHGKAAQGPSLERLSDREIDVLRMMGAGMSSPQIANKLHLSLKTISTYRERLKLKLELESRRALEKQAEEFYSTGSLSLDTL